MSWSVSTAYARDPKTGQFTNRPPLRNARAAAAIDALVLPERPDENYSEAAHEQLEAAKAVAKELLHAIPGPFVHISLGGHANGVGHHAQPGYANDCITVSVSQVLPEDVQASIGAGQTVQQKS